MSDPEDMMHEIEETGARLARAREMIARLEHAQLETIPGVAHQIPFARPRELASLLESFFATV